MKCIVRLFCALLLFLSKVTADPIIPNFQEGISDTITPIKVSEINANLFSAIYDFLQKIGSDLFEGLISLKDFVEVSEWIILCLQTPATRDQIVSFFLRLLIAFVASFFLAAGLSSWLKPKINALLESKEVPSFEKFKKLLSSAFLSTLTPLFFGFVFYAFARLMNSENEVYQAIARIISSGIVTIWVLLNLAHLFLRPLTPAHQHIPFSRDILMTSYVWVRRMAFVALFGFFFLKTGTLISLPIAGEKLLLQGTGLIIAIMAILMMRMLHKEIKEWIQLQLKNPRLSIFKRAMLPYLHYSYAPVIVCIIVSYASWATQTYDPFLIVVWKSLLTLTVFPGARIVALCLRKIRILYLYNWLYRYPFFFLQSLILYGRQIDFVMLILSNGVALFVALEVWGANPSQFIFSNTGKALIERVFGILVIIVVALGITRTGNALLSKYLKITKAGQTELQKQKTARFNTIYSVSRNVLRIAVWTPAVLLVIVEMDINIMPLLATVGIFSVGLSFGVQSLVKDFVTGFFMLLEDAFAVDDLVVINGQLGRIESLTVRVVRLRAKDGSLHTFPYGDIKDLCNQNREYSAAVMYFQVGFEADVQQIFDILEKIDKELRKDPVTRNLVIGPIEIDGITEVKDYALEIRAVLKTSPGEYQKVRWAFNRLLKQYLEAGKVPPATPRHISYNYGLEK